MSENELGEYLRANGLHATEIEQWKQDIYSSQNTIGRPKLDSELIELRNKKKELVRDLKRKDRALPEMSARVILRIASVTLHKLKIKLQHNWSWPSIT